MHERRLRAGSSRVVPAALGLVGVLSLVLGCGGGGDGWDPPPLDLRTLQPGGALSVSQVSFAFPNAPHPYTRWGRLTVDPQRLKDDLGVAGGRLNVATSLGWAVANLPVLPAEDGPYATYFDLALPSPQPIQEIELRVWHSNRGVDALPTDMGPARLWPVDDWTVDASGIDLPTDPGLPPPALDLGARFADLGPIATWTQATTNEPCAHNQCMTMAAANALAYLDDRGVIALASPHGPGLGGDATLVGLLDLWCGRDAVSRAVGDGLWFRPLVDGTFGYLDDEGLDGTLVWRHQGRGYYDSSPDQAIPAGDFTAWGDTSLDDGVTIRFGWIRARVADGCGVVAVYRYDAGGGHAVRVTAAGYDDAGRPWVRYAHDALQTDADPTDTEGLESVVVALQDLDGDGRLEFGSPNRELVFVWAACP